MRPTQSSRSTWFLVAAAVVALVLLAPDPLLAGPGAIVKQAARTTLGKIVFGVLVVVFLPLIVWFMAKRAILVRRTRASLQQLGMRVSHFSWLPLKERITEVFGWVHSAWDRQKMELARGYMTEWYVRNQQLQLDKWERDGLRNVTSDVRIKTITPLYVSHDPASPQEDRVVVEIVAEMRDYVVEAATGQVVQGDKALGELSTIWSFVREDGAWVVANIEADDMVLEYLTMPDRVPLAVSRPA